MEALQWFKSDLPGIATSEDECPILELEHDPADEREVSAQGHGAEDLRTLRQVFEVRPLELRPDLRPGLRRSPRRGAMRRRHLAGS